MAAEAVAQVVAILKAAPGVTALVGTAIGPLIRPQDIPLPSITLQRITTQPANVMAGDGGLDETRLQVDCWAASYTDARAVATAVRNAMKAVPILMYLELDNPFELDPVPGAYWITQEYQIWS